MKKIRRIESALPMDGKSWAVGDVFKTTSKGKEVEHIITEIKDMTNEYEHGIDHQYDVYTNHGLHCSIVNMPCVIYYKDAEE